MTEMNLNLIPSKAKFQAAKINLQKNVRTILFGILTLWLFSAALVLGLTNIVKMKIASATIEQKRVIENYASMEDNIMTSQKLKYKAKMVGGILNSRFEYGQSFELVASLFPPTVNLKNYNLNDGGVFEIKGAVEGKNDVDILENTVELVNQGENDKLKKAKLTTISLKDNIFDFTMEVQLK
jgi:hypothetical protein